MAKLSPMMQQYLQLKEKHKDMLLLFRLGDFYEMFFEDAELASRELELTLTGRDCGLAERAPMCGVPYHALETYVNRLLAKGYKVAISEQLTDPAESKGLVERDVVRIITPGTVIESSILEEKNNNYLVSLYLADDTIGIAYGDVSTGDFFCTEFDMAKHPSSLMDELVRIQPREVLSNAPFIMALQTLPQIKKMIPAPQNPYSEEIIAQEKDGMEPPAMEDEAETGSAECAKSASALLWRYLQETQKNILSHMGKANYYSVNHCMGINASARYSLELCETMRTRSRKGSLLWLMDNTRTAMGGRTFRKWLERPLSSPVEINARLDAVEELKGNIMLLDSLSENLQQIKDIERLVGKLSYKAVNARDCLGLGQSAQVLPSIRELLGNARSRLLQKLCADIDPLEDVNILIGSAIAANPPISLREGGMIREGYDAELDKLRTAYSSSREIIAQMETAERETTGIKNLKIGFNKVFGFYIEVTRSSLELVPYRYQRKQTLANGERYITPELKELEDVVLNAEERSIKLEYDLFCRIRDAIEEQIPRLQRTARAIGRLDCLVSLAMLAQKNNYVRPEITTDGCIHIVDGRHPVVEQSTEGNRFVPNNTLLDKEQNRFLIITGPNMAGKSTYLRQVALLTIMAHMGSFVPAKKASICIVDHIFTRIGASDDLYSGQSTFMVEMSEMADILSNATPDSLIILDEIGRGTSTYDGLSIAWAVVEHLCDPAVSGAKTLFATHYHELTELEDKASGIKNYSITVREQGDEVVFLRKIVRGGADKSFGIHVAALAGIPPEVVERAKSILHELETADVNRGIFQNNAEKTAKRIAANDASVVQMNMIDVLPYSAKLEEIRTINLDTITPLDAMYLLKSLQSLMKES